MNSTNLNTISFPLRVGGDLALDFTNTAEFRGSEHFVEFLPTYTHWLAWCAHVGALSAAEHTRLQQISNQEPATAAKVLVRVQRGREAIYAIGVALSRGDNPPAADVATLNADLAISLTHRTLVTGPTGLTWGWQTEPRDLAQPLWPLLFTAAELLSSPQVARLGQCPGCGWLFLDTSRGGRRRWCSMDFCGSKEKSRRQYARKLGIESRE